MSAVLLARSVDSDIMEAYNGNEDEDIIQSKLLDNKASREEAISVSVQALNHRK